MQGRSLLPLIDRTAIDWPREIFVQISESQVGRALRPDRWSYGVVGPSAVAAWVPAADRYVEDVLYDLHRDPAEHQDLAGQPEFRAVAEDLAASLIRRMVAAGETPPRILPAPVT